MAVFRWLARSLGFGDPFADAKLRARLTEAEALAIAQKAMGSPLDLSLYLADITEEAGELSWTFSTSTRGIVWHVKVRDRDGQVVGSGRFGIR